MTVPRLSNIFLRYYTKLILINNYEMLTYLMDFIYCMSGPIGRMDIDIITYKYVGYNIYILPNCIILDEFIL
jgi:hypothetical protein